MSRRKTEINPKRADNVKALLEREKITQKELAEKICMTQQNINRIVNKKNALVEETAKDIIKAFPEYRFEWLMAYDDIMLKTDYQKIYYDSQDRVHAATITIMDKALKEVCAREGITKVPVLDNIPELLLIQAQILDYADSLLWNYIKYRENSNVWSYLDQISAKHE